MPGTPRFELVDTPDAFRRTADALSRGCGPFALDTERASTFRYDDRAFLVQVHRRGAGTFLIAPEGHRDAVRETLAPVIGGGDWILHAAGEDLPSMAELGLHPGRLFDTELAARLGGFPRSNLAAMVEHFTGVVLEKGHGREDWSVTPLPADWQVYAAQDVIHLNDLAEALAEHLDAHGKLGMAEQEFSHLAAINRGGAQVPGRTWRDVKGVSSLADPAQLQVARALWTARDARGRAADISPHTILPNRVLVDLARTQPATARDIALVKGFPRRRRGAPELWAGVIREALQAERSTWPERKKGGPGAPAKQWWERNHPDSWSSLLAARTAVADRAAELAMPAETLLQSAVLRELVWHVFSSGGLHDTDSVARGLAARGARPWQVEETAAPISGALS